MTREEKLYSMTGTMLIEVGAKIGIKITKNDLKKGKAKVIAKIMEVEAAKAQAEAEEAQVEEIAEAPTTTAEFLGAVSDILDGKKRVRKPKTSSEAPQIANEGSEEDGKQKAKASAKRANLKLRELTYNGETKSIKEWAAEKNMPWPTLYDRVNRNGWTVEDAIETPLGQRRPK